MSRMVAMGAAVVLLGLASATLPSASVAAPAPPLPQGGVTPATATPIKTGVRYSGTVAGRMAPLWYEFRSEGAEGVRFELAGTLRMCPFRATILDTQQHGLGQLVSMLRETLPLAALFPSHPVSDLYYLRIDADPQSACPNPGYAFTLIQPEQTELCSQVPGASGEPHVEVCAYQSVPLIVPLSCINARVALQRIRGAVRSERSMVDRRRGSVRVLRRLEAEERAARRRLHRACR